MRIGQGYDVHRLVEGRKLILGGVTIPYEKGLLGHSDADVLVHAVMDALLGAGALGDIGQHFPDTDPAYEGISSIELLEKVGELLEEIYRESRNFDCENDKFEAAKQAMARQQMAEAMKRFKNVYFIDKAGLTGTDHVTSADGTHPSDLGYWRWAQNLQPELLKVLKKHGIR